MSQSPLARSTRRPLQAFAHPPSRLSRSHAAGDAPDSSPSPSTNAFASSSNHNAFATPPREPRHRSTGTGTLFSPAPKILYSPYATSTPPAGLSKSTSIPFDMAASARAARKAEAADQGGVEGTPVVKPKRFVRTKPLWQRIAEAPRNVLDSAVFHFPTTVDDILPPAQYANPIALATHAIHYLLLAPLFVYNKQPQSILRSSARSGVDSRWDRIEQEATARSGMIGGRAAFLLTALLLALAVANSVYLFTRFKTYDMQLRSAQEPVHSPHASPVSAPRAAATLAQPEEGEETGGQKAGRLAKLVVISLIRWSYAGVLSAFGRRPPLASSSSGDDKIQSLRVWEPPEFCLAFFCALPPSAPVLSYLLTPRHPFITPLLHATTCFLLAHLATAFAQLVKDRMLLAAEVMREYDRRFVYKRVFASRVDRGVGTHEAELVL
ncbi:hypothetical protein Q5752_003151 [Cryptotrichosporon argae]